ncbi:MAG TPA: aspartate aminotransferase family protein [Acidimicrobiia bacterium]|nr:aspartate aminotransferase family protein [Acidimicrobiia bacterium]
MSSTNPILSFSKSESRIAAACRLMPRGVGSDFRLGISPTPVVIERGEGAELWDIDGNRLIDYYLGMGPMILGHRPQPVVDAVRAQLEEGFLFAGQSEIEYRAAELVTAMVPCAEMVRFGSAGTEAVQAALRLARAATGRQAIVAFEGHYHGWLDNVLWNRGADGTLAPKSAGQDPDSGRHWELHTWNRADEIVERLERGDVAGIIMEPSMCNASAIRPAPGYLQAVRDACDRNGTVLIFDEVITGFRVGPGGAQARLGVTPDLAVFGKAIANGFPVSALAGRRELMEQIGGSGGVIHAGTYNGQAIGMAATVATLTALQDGSVHDLIEDRGTRLMEGLAALLEHHGVPAVIQGWPQIFHVAFGTTEPIIEFGDLSRTDPAAYVRFTSGLMRRGVRALERGAWFLSSAHDDDILAQTLEAVDSVLTEVAV